MVMSKQYHILPGQKFNRLTCIGLDHVGKHNRSHFLFRCDCGKEKIILGSLVKSGNTRSCGCLNSEIKRAQRISKNHSEVTAIMLGYKRHAKNRGFEFLLTRDEVVLIIKKNCYYCGDPPSNRKRTKNSIDGGLQYSGIDRVDSSKNYTPSNVVPCCDFCNKAKGARTQSEFFRKIRQVASQWGGKG